MSNNRERNPDTEVPPATREGSESSQTEHSEKEEVRQAVQALQAGGPPAHFEVIFREYYSPLVTFFRNRAALRDEAEDLTNEVLLKAFEKIDRYEPKASFYTWLRTIAENHWKNAVRDRQTKRRAATLTSLEVVGTDRNPPPVAGSHPFSRAAPTPEEEFLAAERTAVLSRALDTLPAGMRRMTELRLGSDLRYQEIADVTGVTLNTVRSQLSEARDHLRPVLDRYFGSADL